MRAFRLFVSIGLAIFFSAALGIKMDLLKTIAPTQAMSLQSPAQTVTMWGCLDAQQFQPVLDEFSHRTGISTDYEVVCDQDEFRRCVENDDCPDAAVAMRQVLLNELGEGGTLVNLGPFINTTVLNTNYAPTWVDLGTVNGTLYGVWFNANNKSLVWYDPGEFSSHSWSVPATWTEMMTLSQTISDTTTSAPWSIGIVSGSATGWPLTDWFENILLRSAGPAVYDDLLAHDIPWTHPEVISATMVLGELFGNPAYQLGGKGGTLYTSFFDAIFPPFNDPPEAYLHSQGSFTQNILQGQFPTQVAGVDYSVFPFPDVEPVYTQAVMGTGDVVIVFKDNTETQALVNFLITTDAAEIWILQGNLSPNRSVDMNLYPNPNTRAAANWLANASLFRFDLSDQLPGRLNQYVWSQMDDLVQAAPDAAAMEAVLAHIEFMASHPYDIFAPLMMNRPE